MSDKSKPESVGFPPGEAREPVPEWLGIRLRRLFDDVMDEPVPDELRSLLRQLEEKERGA